MTTIYKYQLEITANQTVAMPNGHNIINVGLDPQGAPCIWAIVDTSRSVLDETVRIVGTGHKLPLDAGRHIGSFNQGPFVWHAFIS